MAQASLTIKEVAELMKAVSQLVSIKSIVNNVRINNP